jgi:uncharacterized membrane protein
MRTVRDRLRHALSFEIIGLLLIIPLGALAFSKPLHDIGVIGIAGSVIATGWNYLYNLIFDHIHKRITGTTLKSLLTRIGHAVLFEAGLLIVLLPFIAWYLDISLIEALVMDAAFAIFYLAYAYVFNLAYDRLFPLAEWQEAR